MRAIAVLRILRLSAVIRSIEPGLIRNQIGGSTEGVYTRRRVYIREGGQTYFHRESVGGAGGGGPGEYTTLGSI